MECFVNNFSKEELKEIVDSSNSLSEVVIKCGYANYQGGARRTVKKRIFSFGLEKEFEQMEIRAKEERINRIKTLIKNNTTDFDKMFCENSEVNRSCVRKYILKNNILEYKCAICGNTGEHLGKPLTLQLDHINGIFNDHRLENLRWLCPNCHSQTETWGASKKTLENKFYKEKEEQKRKANKDSLILKRKKYFDSIDATKWGWITKASQDLGISRTQVRRWLKKYYPTFNM